MTRERGQLPKAYLRIDPNIHRKHPDVGAFVHLLCEAAAQEPRGRFRERVILERLFGRRRVAQFIERGDLVLWPDGTLYVDGWDEWQEGDHTVAERMRKLRAKRNRTVTPAVTEPSPGSISPSEASGVRRQASGVNGSTDTGVGGQASGEPARPPADDQASALDRDGAPGEAEALRRELAEELRLAAVALRTPADVLLARHSRTPSGRSITNPASVASVPWLRATLDQLRGARLSAEGDAAEDARTRASPARPTAAAQARRAGADALIAGGLRGDGSLVGEGHGDAGGMLLGSGPGPGDAGGAGRRLPPGPRRPDR